jgi:hypothetical protein
MDIIKNDYSFNWGPTPNLGSFFCLPKRTKPRKGQFPVSFSRHMIMSSKKVFFVGSVTRQQMAGLRPLKHPPSLPRQMQRQHNGPYCFMFGPIREISVELRGTRVKKFNVFEPRYFRGELLNFTEY